MKLNITVDLDDLYFEDYDGTMSEEIKSIITNRIKGEIISNINKDSIEQIKKVITVEVVSKRDKLIAEKVKNVFENEKFEIYKGKETTLDEYVCDKIQQTYVVDNYTLRKEIERSSQNQFDEFKKRYDNLFAVEIIKKLNENKMLSDKASKLLFDDENN